MLLMRIILATLMMIGAPADLFGASIKKVNAKKGQVIVAAGKADGLAKNDRICFFDGEKRVACGKVWKLKRSSALIRVSKKAAKRLNESMEARLPSEMMASGGGKRRGQKKDASSSGLSKLKFAYIVTPITPVSYQKLTYSMPEAAGSETLWSQTEASSNSLLGFGGEYEVGLSGGAGFTVGGRIRYDRPFISTADYKLNAETEYAEVSQASSALGFWTDYYYLTAGMFRLGNGIDLDLSTQSLSAAHKTDAGDESLIAEATTKMTTISLRTIVALDIYLDPVGLHIGTVLLLPLSASGSTKTDVIDPQASQLAVDANEDLAKAIDHKKNTFGLELFIAGYIAF